MDNDVDSVVCPECGGNVCHIGRIERRWPDQSLVIPRVLWIMVLGVFLLVSTPWAGSLLGSQSAMIRSVQQSEDYGVRLHEPLVSGEVVRNADGGDGNSRRLVLELLSTIAEETDRMGPRETVRFDFVDPAGSLHTGESWGIGGSWFAQSSNLALHDLRDSSTIEDGYYGKPYDSWSWFSFSRYRIFGGQANNLSVGLDNILSIIATCLVAVYLVRRAGRRFGIGVFGKRHSRALLFVMLLVGATVFAFNHHSTEHSLHSRGKVGGSTAWYSAPELHEAIHNSEKMELLIESISQAIPEGDPDDWLLGETRDRGYNIRFSMLDFALDPLLSIGGGSYMSFFIENQDGTTTRINRPVGYLENGFRMNAGLQFFSVSWIGKKSVSGLNINPTQIMLGIVVFYWLWKIAHAMSRFVFYRFERRRTRKRIRRDQCIFCAYPLSDEGKMARSLGIGP